MAWYVASVILFWCLCGLMSAAALKEQPWTDRPAFVVFSAAILLVGVGGLLAGSSAAASAVPAYGVAFFVIGVVPGILLLSGWIVRSVRIFTDEAQSIITAHDQMTFRRTYDLAGKAMHEKRFEDAEREYLAGAAEDKDDSEPLRLAGEAALSAGDAGRAVTHFRDALARVTSKEGRASLAVRISEIEERRIGDRAGARRTLEQVLPDLHPGKWGDFVRERLDRLG